MHLKEITSQGYYIYEAPVRLWHWITALSIVVLAVTGYFIGRPLPSIQGEATFMFWMGWIRLIHFTTAYIFTVALLFRIYWACVGNEYAREMFLVPFSGAAPGAKALSAKSAGIFSSKKRPIVTMDIIR